MQTKTMNSTGANALDVADAKLCWETDDGPLESHFSSGLLRWQEGNKEQAELLLKIICEDSVYEVKLRYSFANKRFMGTWETTDDCGTANCQIYREEIGDDVALDGIWNEGNRSFAWTGLVTLDEAAADD